MREGILDTDLLHVYLIASLNFLISVRKTIRYEMLSITCSLTKQYT